MHESSLTFAQQLRALRLRAGLSQAALAESAGLSTDAIAALERGLRRSPYPRTVAAVATALGLTAEERASLVAAARGDAPDRVRKPESATGVRLPIRATPLVGRQTEVAQIKRMLDPHASGVRLLTLVGPGGIGKTRLAIEIASLFADATCYSDGVAFVELASFRDHRLVAATIARALQLPDSSLRDSRDVLLEWLTEKQLLLVLDNFEHLSSAAPLISELVARCPRLAVLVTSRVALRVGGEQRFQVAPLPTPPAEANLSLEAIAATPSVRLFVDRARAAVPEFALTPANSPAVAAVCRQLEGIPLALELAATRIQILSPAGLLRRLGRRMSVLTGGPESLPLRQRTLWNTIDWSYRLLEPAAQRLFQRVAVFVSGCTVDAVEQVCTDLEVVSSKTLLAQLTLLVDASLLHRKETIDREPRLFMLDTLREYALEQLASAGEEKSLRARHLEWCVTWAESADSALRGPSQTEFFARLELEHDNMRAALSWSLERPSTDPIEIGAALRLCGALVRFWSAHGYSAEGCTWLERAFNLVDEHSPFYASAQWAPARARALLGQGWLYATQGDFDRAERSNRASLAIYSDLADARGMAAPLLALAHLAEYRGNTTDARDFLLKSIEHARAAADDNQVGEALCWLAQELYRDGDLDGARSALAESVALLTRTGDIARLAGTLFVRGVMEAEEGNHRIAVRALARSAEIYRDAGDKTGEVKAEGWLGYANLHAGNYGTARKHLSRCLEWARHDGLNELPMWLAVEAVLTRAEGHLDRAWILVGESLEVCQRMRYPASTITALEVAGGLFVAMGRRVDSERAARLFGAADATRAARSVRMPPVERRAYERDLAVLRRRVTLDVFARGWNEGRAETLEQALADALRALPPA
jgi:predicted ATPase/DNA-binding XRE family transcriptional regulator